MKNLSSLKPLQPTSESGFTIIESLLAIVIVTIMLVGIAPVLTLAVANRVQAKRVEAASQAAQAYIDGVRSGAISHPKRNANTFEMRQDSLADHPVPTKGNLTCSASAYCTAPAVNLFCVDGDDDGLCTNISPKDVIVQGFGFVPNNNGQVNARGYKAYKLGVRVYRADGFGASGNFTRTNFQDNGGKNKQQKAFGNMARNSPLLEQSGEIAVDDGEFSSLCQAAGLNPATCN
ncbi:MAG: hormogonium polysaccharide secretion pseudopilin HpsB [Jaaginema sp. PMC 1079.18]|nr:hormogonium polysaccharide secretion pseudopilin HpsB [Jaaginema sp. PMC 1080.18]MEC4850542.1 hormogonium polysaccharide secretion pseudopilin HpsB [Jaaginema sp. PMC 1079.18]MEC4867666.1 hormogonium polysaccharide secretion pseudopilin HpsB [Jaaginema sp. PMC 1078.18]